MSFELEKKLSRLILEVPEKNYGKKNNVNIDWIEESEKIYLLKLPEHYKWFLIEYDFIILWGEMTKTVFPPDLQQYSDQDIFNYYQIEGSEDKVVFLITEDLTEYYFKVLNNKAHDQVYTYNYISESENIVSDNFISFLIQEIPRNYF